MSKTVVINLPSGLQQMVEAISNVGGKAMLVGGGVIDSLQGREVKDWDVEVFGLSYSQLYKLLRPIEKPNLIGKAFGIINIRYGGISYDFSIPRKENRVGVGHKDFDIQLCPDITPEEAGKRRDITINSMYVNLHTMELVDPFGGLADLEAGIIRATNAETFVEDPLRVLRIMQLLPRKGKTVDHATVNLCYNIHSFFDTLPKERVFEEFEKLLMKASLPSRGLEFLADCGWAVYFPEINDLILCQQNPKHHPEGNVWRHTMLAVDYAAGMKKYLPEEWQLAYMFGVLLHDVGKPSTTDILTLTAHGHDVVGVEIAERFMRRITNETHLIERVKLIVGLHMRVNQLHRAESGIPAWKRLHNKCRLDVLGHVQLVDHCASGRDMKDDRSWSYALACFKVFGDTKIPPIVMGRHLIDKGLQPGKEFKVLLDKAYEIQIETGSTDVEWLLSQILER